MLYRNLKTFKEKHTQIILGVVFVVFIFTQLVSLHHQVQHLNDYNDIACVQCISTPDLLDEYLPTLWASHQQETIVYHLKHITKYNSTTLSPYSARAPPTT